VSESPLSQGLLLDDLFPPRFLAVVLLLVFELFEDALGFSLFLFSVLLAIVDRVVRQNWKQSP